MKKALIILFIFVLAFSLRILFMAASTDGIESDEVEYDRLARNLVALKGYINSTDGLPTALRPPLYPAFLAFIYIIFGRNLFIVRIIQAVLGSLAVCLLYLTAERIFNRTTAVLTGIFSSFYMTFVVCAKLLYTETIFMFLLVLITYLVVISDKPGIAGFCLLGFLCGALTLIRSAGFFMPFVILFFMLIKNLKVKEPLKRVFLAGSFLLFSFVLTVLPWTVRNYRAFHKLVPVSTNAGLNMYQAVKPVGGKLVGLGPRDEIAKKANAIANEAERNTFFMKAAFSAYSADPLSALKMFVLRFLFYWNVIDWEIIGGDAVNYHYVFILPFAVLGIFFALSDKKDVLMVLLVVFYMSSMILIFQGTPRYRMPIDGYIIMLGCYGIYEFIRRQKEKFYPLLCTGAYFTITYVVYKYSLQVKFFIRRLMERVGLW